MGFRVVLLRRAEDEVDSILAWLVERSPQGAQSWLAALERAKTDLAENPGSFGLAPEDAFVDMEVRQVIFKTRRGRRYRAIFTIVENELRILHVRGPGQSTLGADDFALE
jgi:plasmid stabilization system protein ParE